MISFENLVTILPIGFESKNKIFALITMFDIALCSLELPSSRILFKLIARITVTIINVKIEAANNPGYFPFFCSASVWLVQYDNEYVVRS